MASPQPQTPLNVLGERYEVLSQLGSGASADVFRVRDARSGAVRAAKVLKSEHAVANADVLARFEDEFRILRTLHHPHLPEVFDYGVTEDGRRFLVMELVEGEPLDQYFRAHPDDVWVILYEICETLVFVHARNLLHQDIKPSNILVSRAAAGAGERPVIKLIDFGLTFRRGVGAAVQLVGTAEYIAPEVVRGERSLTRAVDYYSLGITLYELLYGEPPFNGTESEILRAHLERAPQVENEELEWAELYPHVRALLTKDPQKRLAAFEEFRRAVAGRLTGGIEGLDRSYALARIDSLGMVGKRNAWVDLLRWLDDVHETDAKETSRTFSIFGGEGVGKRYLTDAFRAEAAVRGIRTVLPAEVGVTRSDTAAARQPSLMWSHLLELCEKEPIVLIIERPMSLPDEERSFVRLAGTQWELYRSRGKVLPLFFLVAVDSTTEDADTLDYLPSDGACKVELSALRKDERAQVVEPFRGAMFDSRDARALGTYLERFDDCGSAIQGLQSAVLRGGLTFLGQRWKVQPGLLTEAVESRHEDSFSRDLVASLSPLERSVAAVVAAHPDPVPMAWVADFVGVELGALPSIVAGTLRRLLSASTETLAPVSKTIRTALVAGSDPVETRRAHRFLAQRTAALERTPGSDRAMAHHYQQLGLVRDAARVHLRLLQAYWSIRPRERPYELIEGVCRNGLELLESSGASVAPSTRRHLFCFYLKQWINAFWERNLFTHAKPVIDEWTRRLDETMPASVSARYVRAVSETDGPSEAIQTCAQLLAKLPGGRQLRARLQLEQSLCLHNAGQYEHALEALPVKADLRLLAARDIYRTEIYRAMSLTELGRDHEARELMSAMVSNAERDGCADEALVMHAIVARSLLMEGSTSLSLSTTARSLRLALASGLLLRANLMYRMASTAYEELGDANRSQHCQEKAIQIADTLGLRDVSGISWSRLATAERKAGRYGNALQNLYRAVSLVGEHGPTWSRLQILVGLYGMLVLVQSERRVALERSLAKQLTDSKEHNSLGYFHCWRGLNLEHHGNVELALEAYKQGTDHFKVSAHRSNVAWAMGHQVRTYLRLGNLSKASTLLALIDSDVASSDSREAAFELIVLRVKIDYLSRVRGHIATAHVRECEAELIPSQTASLRIEAMQILFKVYARLGMGTEANKKLLQCRELLLEMSSNMSDQEARRAIELSSVREVVDEYAVLGRRES